MYNGFSFSSSFSPIRPSSVHCILAHWANPIYGASKNEKKVHTEVFFSWGVSTFQRRTIVYKVIKSRDSCGASKFTNDFSHERTEQHAERLASWLHDKEGRKKKETHNFRSAIIIITTMCFFFIFSP